MEEPALEEARLLPSLDGALASRPFTGSHLAVFHFEDGEEDKGPPLRSHC